jgi:hypothetical protein
MRNMLQEILSHRLHRFLESGQCGRHARCDGHHGSVIVQECHTVKLVAFGICPNIAGSLHGEGPLSRKVPSIVDCIAIQVPVLSDTSVKFHHALSDNWHFATSTDDGVMLTIATLAEHCSRVLEKFCDRIQLNEAMTT